MLAKTGPCGIPIVGSGDAAGLVGTLTGRGGAMDSLSSLRGMGGMPAIPGIGAAAKGALPSVASLTGGGATLTKLPAGRMPPELAVMMDGAGGTPGLGAAGMAPRKAQMIKSQMAQMDPSAEVGADGRTTNAPDIAKVM